jgi:hypothetical protein
MCLVHKISTPRAILIFQKLGDIKMITIKKTFSALLLFVLLAIANSASAQSTRNLLLSQGDTQTPAMPAVGLDGEITYYSGFVMGRVNSTNPTTFSFLLTFKSTGLIDPAAGIYGGSIISPSSSFAVTEAVGRKSVSTTGTIDSGYVTYQLLPDGRADIITVTGNLTIWEGKNSKRKAVGNGTIQYGTETEGAGTMVLNFF